MALQYVKFCTGLPETRTTGIAGAVLLTAVVPFFNLKVEYGSDVNQNEAEEQSLGCETTEAMVEWWVVPVPVLAAGRVSRPCYWYCELSSF